MMASVSSSKSNPRDLRLDFFRSIALFLIFIAHTPGNWLAQFRPGCYGFSDSADIFVFISGYAAALAYGKIFQRAGFFAGTARVLKRCGELFACHLGLFFVVAVVLVGGNHLLQSPVDYVNLINLGYFFDHTQEALLGLFTLTYVPNYFDILPMYIVALAILPLFLLLARVHKILAVSLCVALYLSVQFLGLELPAEIASDRPWFFNPFAWQLLFYTGFLLGAGWLKSPRISLGMTIGCAAYVILSIPISHYPAYSSIPWLDAAQRFLNPFVDKTDLGVLRYLHFLCLAYLTVALFNGRQQQLQGRLAAPFVKSGQQALPVFLAGMVLSHVAGMSLDVLGRSIPSTVVVNAAGIVFLILTAYTVAWFKSQPWRVKKASLAVVKEPIENRNQCMEYSPLMQLKEACA
jgi:hypothetical protein